MKTFYASIAIFLIMLGIICVNAHFINGVTEHLERSLCAIPSFENAKEPLDDLEEYVISKQSIMELSISTDVIQELKSRIKEMKAASETADAAEFEISRALALNLVQRLGENEKMTFKNLL